MLVLQRLDQTNRTPNEPKPIPNTSISFQQPTLRRKWIAENRQMSAAHSVYAFQNRIPTSFSGIQQRNVVAQPVALNQLPKYEQQQGTSNKMPNRVSCSQQTPSTKWIAEHQQTRTPFLDAQIETHRNDPYRCPNTVVAIHDTQAPRLPKASGKNLVSIAIWVGVLKKRVLNDH